MINIGEIKKENIVRINNPKLLDKLNVVYEQTKETAYSSKNQFLQAMLKIGVEVFAKKEEDNWAIQHEKQTLFDAIHEHTKRMNYFIKFSKPFIKSTYANVEIVLQMLTVLFNYHYVKMDYIERDQNKKIYERLCKLDDEFIEKQQQLYDLYDYKVE